MENTLYYVFSTIAQMLAGGIGLLAAFAVFSLDILDRRLRSLLEILYSRYPGATETVDLDLSWVNYDVRELLRYFDQDKKELLVGGDGLDRTLYLAPAHTLYKKRRILVSRLRLAMRWTGITIVGSVVVLSLTSELADWDPLAVSCLLGAAIAAVVACLVLYWRIIQASLLQS